jgi:hypothetical protein
MCLRLSLLCPFAKAVWSQILSWEHFDVQFIHPTQAPPHLKSWWEWAASKIPKQEQRRFNGMVICTLWNIWKERNRIIFSNHHELAMQVALRVKEDINQRKRAIAWEGGHIT